MTPIHKFTLHEFTSVASFVRASIPQTIMLKCVSVLNANTVYCKDPL